MKKIKFIGVPSELGAGSRGSSLGIDALRVAGWNTGNDLLNRYPFETLPDENNELYNPVPTPNAIHIEGIVKMYNRITGSVKNCFKENRFPVILSGDHSNAGGTIAGIRMAFPEKRLGVIWVDAHADIHTPYTSPSGNVHGMPIALSLAEDNKENKRNEPAPAAKKYWDELKNLGAIIPKIKYEDLVYIAVRDMEKEEDTLIRKHAIKNFTVDEVNKKGVQKIISETFDRLQDCDHIYISFDVDSLDSAISEGTGTPVPDGLTTDQAKDLLSGLVANPKVCCFEMTEINPTLDEKNKMAETALSILTAAIEKLEN